MKRIIFLLLLLFLPIGLFSQTVVSYDGYKYASGICLKAGKLKFTDIDLRQNFGSPFEIGIDLFYFNRLKYSGVMLSISYFKKTQVEIKNAELQRFILSLSYVRCAFTSEGKMVFYISVGPCWGWRKSKIYSLNKSASNSNIGGNLSVGGLYRISDKFGVLTDIQIIVLKTAQLNTGSITYCCGISYLF